MKLEYHVGPDSVNVTAVYSHREEKDLLSGDWILKKEKLGYIY